MGFDKFVSKHLSNPKGLGGKLVSAVMNQQNIPMYNATIELLKPSDNDIILDIGCGNGYMINMLAKQYGGIYIGIDSSSSILKAAKRLNNEFIKSGRATLLNQSLDSMIFTEKSFDKIYTLNTVYFWEDLDKAMDQIYRLLKPNGVFINTLFSNETLSQLSHTRYGYKRFSIEQLADVGVNAGFNVNIKPILNNAAYCMIYTVV